MDPFTWCPPCNGLIVFDCSSGRFSNYIATPEVYTMTGSQLFFAYYSHSSRSASFTPLLCSQYLEQKEKQRSCLLKLSEWLQEEATLLHQHHKG